MSEPTRKRSTPLLTTLFFVTALASLYLLSLGPAVWFYDRDCLPEQYPAVVETIYFPLDWIYDETEFFQTNPIGRTYWRYVDWWREE